MAKNDLNDLIKKLDRVQNHLGEEVQAKEIKSLEKASTIDIEGIDIFSVIVIQ